MSRLALTLAVAFAGWAAAADLSSDGSETIIQGKTRKQVSDAIAEVAAARGLEIKKAAEDSVVVERTMDKVNQGPRHRHHVSYMKASRHQFTITQSQDGIRVRCAHLNVKDPGRTEETSRDDTNGPGGKKCGNFLKAIEKKLK